jgi:hypothetical protein
MAMTLNLTPDEELKLQTKAAKAGLTPVDYLRSIIHADTQTTINVLPQILAADGGNSTILPKTGAELAAAIDSLGLSGAFGDPRIDSPELARQLRKQAETRR